MYRTALTEPAQRARWQRQISVIGERAQQGLSQARVMVVGLGGLGVPAATGLAVCGVGALVLNDCDVIELSNLSRQFLYTPEDLMQAKVAVSARRLRALRPDMDLTEIDALLDDRDLYESIGAVDAVLDCTDNFASRFSINRAAWRARVPLVSAGALALSGQLSVFDFRNPDSPCYQCLFPRLGEQESDCNRSGILAPVLGVLASMQVMETIRLLTANSGESGGYFYRYQVPGHNLRRSAIERDESCPVCGAQRVDLRAPRSRNGAPERLPADTVSNPL